MSRDAIQISARGSSSQARERQRESQDDSTTMLSGSLFFTIFCILHLINPPRRNYVNEPLLRLRTGSPDSADF